MPLMPYRRFSSDERLPLGPGAALVFFLPVRDTLAAAAALLHSPSFPLSQAPPRAFRLQHVSWVHEQPDLQGVLYFSFIDSQTNVFPAKHAYNV